MEDKLVKYHHKAVYYYFKKAGICFSIFIGAFVAVAIPISIAAGMRNQVVENDKTESGEQEKTEGKLSALLTF